MAQGSRGLTAYQKRAGEIEALFAAGEIGPQTRRALLERARDVSGVAQLASPRATPERAPGGKLIAMNDNQINAAKRAGRSRHDRPRAATPTAPR
ncbi:hypothetical protein [Azospirillum argentinense]|uniref:Uncharacterized protein n=1 Tax=Azospirillum argentinense TaxID=2970906 RepID=A0A5B0L0C8_9PROT|nr:hypothetical protein [Azospirillum argentinense]KAA1057200.1 hypothetical protein FH063_001368 [Azospirillum argentinense]